MQKDFAIYMDIGQYRINMHKGSTIIKKICTICKKYARYMPKICKIYVKICQKYAKKYSQYAKNMHNMQKNIIFYAEDQTNLQHIQYSKYAKNKNTNRGTNMKNVLEGLCRRPFFQKTGDTFFFYNVFNFLPTTITFSPGHPPFFHISVTTTLTITLLP